MKATEIMSGAPTPDALDTAAEWLDQYDSGTEDGNNERDCKTTAEWLRGLADLMRWEARVEDLMRETGATKSQVKAAFARTEAAKQG